MNPNVSLIIPTYNRSQMLVEAVDSCFRSGPGLALEVIVVDDASQEDIQGGLQGRKVQYVRLPQNSGSGAARNRGLSLASGEYVKFLDSDDVLVDDSLSAEYALARQTGADIVASGWQEVSLGQDGSEQPIARFDPPVFSSIFDDLLAGKAVPTSSALYRRDLIKNVDWDASLSKLNDWDYFVRASLVAKNVASAQTCAYRWRQHSGERITSSATFLTNAEEFFKILGKLENALLSMGAMNTVRKKRLAQYLYKELRGAYRYDPALAKHIFKKIQELDPGFFPRDEESSRIIQLLCRIFPIESVLMTYGAVRRVMDRLGL